MRLPEYSQHNKADCSSETMNRIFTQTRDAAYQIIERKEGTYYAIAGGLIRITEAILRDQSTVLSVSSFIHNLYGIDDVYLSMPTVLHRGGVERIIHLELSEEEELQLRNSARILRETIDTVRGISDGFPAP
jgi:L-lactate dehydrogenase